MNLAKSGKFENVFLLTNLGFCYKMKLNITGNKDYVAIWSVMNENVAMIDKNGCITALSQGVTVVRAAVGNRIVECTLTVKQGWTDKY
jgi:hypothetical protein